MYRNGRASFHTNDGTCVMIHVRVLYTPDVKDESARHSAAKNRKFSSVLSSP
jgi:hypothetical protein